MRAIPAVLLFGCAATLGVVMGIAYLRRRRNSPVMIGVHLLLGAAGMEVIAMLLSGASEGSALPPTSLVRLAAALLVTALLTGLATPLVARGSRRTMNFALLTHAGVALSGFLLLLAWAANFDR